MKLIGLLARVLTILLILLVCVTPTPVYAIANPDSPPQINAVYLYQLADSGLGVLIDYYLNYDFTSPITGTPVPAETATAAYMAVFIAADGTTQLKSVAPYTFQASGYGRGLIWIPFTAAEVATYGLTSTSQALYRIWLVGNPGLTWPGDPPKTIGTISSWQTTGDPAVLLAQRVRDYADLLELIWSLDLIQVTALGNRLTTLGESYFSNVIPGLSTLAPSAFSAGTTDPAIPSLDYSTSFGAVMINGSGTVAGSPVSLASGSNTVVVIGVGTFVLTLQRGVVGTVSDGTGTVTGSPVPIVYGSNNVTATVPGTLIVAVSLQDTPGKLEGAILGTGLDLTPTATAFGLSRLVFSGLVWLALSILICAAVFRLSSREGAFGESNQASKVVMLVFDLCIIGGALLGLLHVLVAILMFIAWTVFIGFVLFYNKASV